MLIKCLPRLRIADQASKYPGSSLAIQDKKRPRLARADTGLASRAGNDAMTSTETIFNSFCSSRAPRALAAGRAHHLAPQEG
jgi:hypothetical protein